MPVRLVQPARESQFEMVSAALTHKVNQDEMLLRTWRKTAPDAFTVTAVWPPAHPFYAHRHGLHDPLLLSETVRQTLPLLSHGAYEVPFGHQLLWKDFSWTLDPAATFADGGPAELELHITCDDVTYRRSRAAAISLRADVERGGLPVATAHSRFTIQDRTVYDRLRGAYADAGAATARALPLSPPAGLTPFGRDRFEDVVLAATDRPGRWQLRVDTTHPVLFDHLVDHAPGMLLLEAARQAALAAAYPRPMVVTGMETEFVKYAEMDTACELEAEWTREPGRVRISARQSDREIFSSVVTLAAPPAMHSARAA
ncbi:ScbA/BarX family gamma-butyrolactone biosynthesis protein [Streptomyces sp. NPDC051784]|uniref:ScbA/BarX family gamma-butyrolactone biosynthesis protein n=1 Tax=Streptomyces sp. NPDC051784 TaxID=3155805 RepID=UPI0034212306